MAIPLPRPFSGASRQPAHARTGARFQRVRGADGAHAVSRSSDVRGMAAPIGRPCVAPQIPADLARRSRAKGHTTCPTRPDNRSRFIRWLQPQTIFSLPFVFAPPYLLTKTSKPPAGDRRAVQIDHRLQLLVRNSIKKGKCRPRNAFE